MCMGFGYMCDYRNRYVYSHMDVYVYLYNYSCVQSKHCYLIRSVVTLIADPVQVQVQLIQLIVFASFSLHT